MLSMPCITSFLCRGERVTSILGSAPILFASLHALASFWYNSLNPELGDAYRSWDTL
jgi:hypothetical protein